jgi:hypothetical protein
MVKQPNFIPESSCCYMCQLVCMLLAKHIKDFRRAQEYTCCTNGKCEGWLTSEHPAWHCHCHSNSRQHLLLLCYSPTATVMETTRSTFLASYPRQGQTLSNNTASHILTSLRKQGRTPCRFSDVLFGKAFGWSRWTVSLWPGGAATSSRHLAAPVCPSVVCV